MGRLIDRMDDGENRRIELLARLDGVAAVGEQRRLVLGDDAQARRSAEAGEPAQPLRGGRDIFALKLVAARHDIGVEAKLLHFLANSGYSFTRKLWLGSIVEGLEHGVDS